MICFSVKMPKSDSRQFRDQESAVRNNGNLFMRGDIISADSISCKAVVASSSSSTFCKLRDEARDKPSLIPQSSARTFVACPRFLLKPAMQWPKWSLLRPPAPAGPGLPAEEPSVWCLSLIRCFK